MKDYSRRKFIKQLGAVSILLITGRNAFSFPVIKNNKDFEMLVVGDSIISGQGLKQKDKFTTLTKNWLQNDVFGGAIPVNIKNRSHSGSRIILAEDEIKAMQDANKDLEQFYCPEVNLSFPSTKKQVEIAAREYTTEGKNNEDIKLIMLTGGITNLDVSYIINPFKKNKKLRKLIHKYCDQVMFSFLKDTAAIFPNALITIIGYHPMISNKSSTGEVYNAVLELYEFPRPTKPLLNNILTKQFFKILHSKMSKRSRIWYEDSNKAFINVVKRLNEEQGKQRAVFVRSPITEETCFGTEKSLVWGMGKKGRMNDANYEERLVECTKEIENLKDVKLEFKTRLCELSAIGHPNIEGSKAYAESIKKVLRPIFMS